MSGTNRETFSIKTKRQKRHAKLSRAVCQTKTPTNLFHKSAVGVIDLTLTAITYDAIGNPTNYLGSTLTWQMGRELASLTKDGVTYNYKYNYDGLRTYKSDGTNTYNYIWQDGKLISQTVAGNTIKFIYEGDKPTAINYNGTEYYYVTNLQGDIIAILDKNGNCVVEYTYDAWGKILSVTGSLKDSLGQDNPLRYRGYCYDNETGFYYLQSRYYDPTVGRFINADEVGYLGVNGTIPSYNLFAYCENNPVNYSDPTGCIAANVIGAAIGAVLGIVGGAFLGNWLADILKLSGWKRWVFVGGVPVLVGAAAATIGYFIGPYVAKIAVKLGHYVLELLKKGKLAFKRLSKNSKKAIRTLCKNACFVAGTQISTEHGLVPIEEIAVGDKVWAKNPYTGEAGYKTVTDTFINKTTMLVKLNIEGNNLTTTPDHPFWTNDKGWQTASMLQYGDTVLQQDGKAACVLSVEFVNLDTPTIVYNFEVEDWHTYYVGNTSILVHNMCAKDFIKSPKNAKQVIKYLKEQGFQITNQTGSHVKLTDGLKTTIVPNHGAKDIAIGTLKSIMKQAGLL